MLIVVGREIRLTARKPPEQNCKNWRAESGPSYCQKEPASAKSKSYGRTAYCSPTHRIYSPRLAEFDNE